MDSRKRRDTRWRGLLGGWLVMCLLVVEVRASEPELSKEVYDQLVQAQELSQQEQHQQALNQLQALARNPDLSPYEAALTHQTLGHVYAGLNRFDQAIEAFQASLAGQALPPERAHNLRYNMGQIMIAAERYEEGAQVLETWLADEAEPTPRSRAVLAQVYSQLKRHAEAEQHIRLAIDQDASFHEEWYQLLLFASLEQQKLSQAVDVLHQLLNRLPRKKNYWLQLSQVYMQAEQQERAASALALAHALGLLEEQEVLYVVQSYLQLGLPYKAAELLDEGLATQTVANTETHRELLVTCWLHAKEYQRALDVLEQEARTASSGKAHIRRAELLAEMERWPEAAAAIAAGVARGELADAGKAYMLLGIAEYRSDKLDESQEAFTKAAGYQPVARQARRWLTFIAQEKSKQSS